MDELVNDVFLDSIEMFPDGRDDFENIKWAFKTREQRGKKKRNWQKYHVKSGFKCKSS